MVAGSRPNERMEKRVDMSKLFDKCGVEEVSEEENQGLSLKRALVGSGHWAITRELVKSAWLARLGSRSSNSTADI